MGTRLLHLANVLLFLVPHTLTSPGMARVHFGTLQCVVVASSSFEYAHTGDLCPQSVCAAISHSGLSFLLLSLSLRCPYFFSAAHGVSAIISIVDPASAARCSRNLHDVRRMSRSYQSDADTTDVVLCLPRRPSLRRYDVPRWQPQRGTLLSLPLLCVLLYGLCLLITHMYR